MLYQVCITMYAYTSVENSTSRESVVVSNSGAGSSGTSVSAGPFAHLYLLRSIQRHQTVGTRGNSSSAVDTTPAVVFVTIAASPVSAKSA